MSSQLAYQVPLEMTFDEALEAVAASLKDEGFGILTTIDVKSTLKEKLGEDFRPYMILGACNPPLAHRALSTDPAVGVMLPCNVTLEQRGGDVLVSLANPEGMLTFGHLAENPALQEIAQEANVRIKRVASALAKVAGASG